MEVHSFTFHKIQILSFTDISISRKTQANTHLQTFADRIPQHPSAWKL